MTTREFHSCLPQNLSVESRQAIAAGILVVEAAFRAEAIACEALTESEFDIRQGWASVPDLVSVSQAAELLGVSRQRVLQRINEKNSPATQVGRDYVIPRSAVRPDSGHPRRCSRMT